MRLSLQAQLLAGAGTRERRRGGGRASSARGCHEGVTSHNSADPRRAEGLRLRGPAGLAPGRDPASPSLRASLRVYFSRMLWRQEMTVSRKKGGVLITLKKQPPKHPLESVFWPRLHVGSAGKMGLLLNLFPAFPNRNILSQPLT